MSFIELVQHGAGASCFGQLPIKYLNVGKNIFIVKVSTTTSLKKLKMKRRIQNKRKQTFKRIKC